MLLPLLNHLLKDQHFPLLIKLEKKTKLEWRMNESFVTERTKLMGETKELPKEISERGRSKSYQKRFLRRRLNDFRRKILLERGIRNETAHPWDRGRSYVRGVCGKVAFRVWILEFWRVRKIVEGSVWGKDATQILGSRRSTSAAKDRI